jgi:hypothetical protein
VTLVRRTGAVVLLSTMSLYLTAGRGVSPGDESWFLLVAKRVADGDGLYRDVFYSPLPLAVYVTAAPVALFGAHIAIVEVLIALTWACTACLVVAHACRVTGSRAVAAVALMALVVAAPPQRNSLYTPLAMLLLLVCMLLTPQLVEAGGARHELLAGAVAGLSFASKQTVGAAALAALLCCIALAPHAGRARGLLLAVAGFATVSAAVALVLAAGGVLDDAVRTGFTGKGGYLAYGSVSYTRSLLDAVRFLPSEPAAAFDTLPLLLAPPVAVLLVAASGRRALSVTVLIPAAFAIGAVAAAYPRLGATHLGWANPALIASAMAAIGPQLRGRRLAITAAPLAVGCAIAAAIAPWSWGQGQLVVSSLPVFQGMPLERATENETAPLRRLIRPGESIFFVTERAGFLYLVTGARNPTPYDVPATSNVGPREVAAVVADVRAGVITSACFGSRAYRENPSLRPFALERVLRRELRPVVDVGLCVLYRPQNE